MMNTLKTLNNIIILILIVVSCNSKKEDILYLKNNQNNFLKIHYKNDNIEINENNFHRPLKIFRFYKDEYLLGNKENKTLVFLSNKKDYKYNLVDEFFLLDDSIIVKKINNVSYYTLVKSNNKPVIIEYFYDKRYKISKINYKIGKQILVYE